MPESPFLIRLSQRLTDGLSTLPESRRERHRAFLRSCQRVDGGFAGREGDSDLYYTSFAVRGLGLLGGMTPDECVAVARFLQTHDWRRLNVIDLVNFVYTGFALQIFSGIDLFADETGDWADELLGRLESVRTADGGYAKAVEGTLGSTYHSFLVALTYDLLGRPIPMPNRLIQFLFDRQRDDGGFVEIDPMRRSGTNPTAAATETLLLLGAMSDDIRKDVRYFLSDVRSGEGGFQANTRIPFADGLSTFTGLLTLRDLGISTDGVIPTPQVVRFVTDKESGLEFPSGGFRAAGWDQSADVEYTFYGLGILGLIGPEAF